MQSMVHVQLEGNRHGIYPEKVIANQLQYSCLEKFMDRGAW